MTFHTALAALAAAFVITACGGGGGDGSSDAAIPEATAVGEPIAEPTRAVIGSAGGTLHSADGSVSVEVPAGAFARDETITLQEISHQNHGAPGRAWRIGPATLTPALPLTLRLQYGESDLQGTDATELRLAYQDAQRRWIVPASPALDTTSRTLTLSTRRLGDWSRFARLSLAPSAATVKVGQQLALKVVRCEVVGFEGGAEGSDPQLVKDCQPDPLVKTNGPRVNGEAGGNATLGTAVWPDPQRAEYLYTAPATVPTPRTVALSVQTLLSASPGSPASTFLVSNITIEDGDGCAWAQQVDAFDYDLRVAAFTVRAAADHARYEGTGKLEVTGRLQRVTPAGLPVVVFSSFGQGANGLVNVHGTLQVDDPAEPYTQTYAASGAPSGRGAEIPPAMLVLSIDARTCTYAFAGGAVTHGSVQGGPNATGDAVLPPGELHFKDMPLPTGTTRVIAVDALEAPFQLDTESNGFAPWTSLLPLPFEPGSTLISWRLSPAAP